MRKYFGTDGIRGEVGRPPITADFFLKLGWAAGTVLAGGKRGKIVIGKDTRISGYMFESVLEAGLTAAGVDAVLLGPMPTPAVAYLTRTLRATAGIVISASHNPYSDNGIKFFTEDGGKLSDDVEIAIEAAITSKMQTVGSTEIGKAVRIDDAAGRYIEFCKSTVPPDLTLKGLRIVVDCAHGATYHIAPNVFSELGAEVISIGCAPNGLNINDGVGVLAPGALRDAVRERRADLGIAFDGDGDRVMMIDAEGEIVDGDELLYIIAEDRHCGGRLNGSVVGTVMSNRGLEVALQSLGVDLHRAKVGDRHVMELMQEHGSLVGGEASGHIICLDRTTTGDGIVAALQVLHALIRSGRTLGEAKKGMSKYPQITRNVRLANRIDLDSEDALQDAVAAAEADLGTEGRVLLRLSGTEPMVRIMVEGTSHADVETYADRLAEVVTATTLAER
ncbi:MAG: phosphoglucosamine mutase [Thiotrichales bacterium]|nr:phosphoglucosamine mutase [Thiotrichales bacterium]